MTSKLEQLLSTEELAEHLGLPKQTLYQWAYRGVGPRRIRVGKHTRYRASDVEAWLADAERGPDAA